MRKSNLIGHQFEWLTVLEDSGKRTPRHEVVWKCICDCGNIAYYRTNKLTSGRAKSCGCKRYESKKLRERLAACITSYDPKVLSETVIVPDEDEFINLTLSTYQYKKLSNFCKKHSMDLIVRRYIPNPSRAQISINKKSYYTFLHFLSIRDRMKWKR